MTHPHFWQKLFASLSNSRRLFVIVLLLLPNISLAQQRPNILFILLDDMGKEWVSAFGSDSIQTPHIDALAQTGMRFNNVYSNPQCTPSRMSLLTGQYPFRHGWVNHWDSPRWGHGYYDWASNPSLAQVLKDAGYATAAAGKWQINDFRIEPEAMSKHGFDDYLMWTGYESGVPASNKRYWDPYLHNKQGSKTYQGKFSEDLFSDFLLDFTAKHKDQPWFFYYAMALPHHPLVATPHAPNAKSKMEKYTAMVSYADFILDKVLQGLQRQGLRENTIVVWTTDNGSAKPIVGSLNGRTIPGGKGQTIESGVNMPFIVNAPGQVPAGVVSEALIDFSDILPTFAELAQAKIPTEQIIDGHSFAPVLTGQAQRSSRDWILAMGGLNNARVSDQGVENQFVFRDRVVRDERYKLYFGPSPQRKLEKLVDLHTDPSEQHNLLHSDKPQIQAALRKLLQAKAVFLARDNDPNYRPRKANAWDKKVTVTSQQWKQ